MGSFELFIGYLGNGATVCNKAVEANGDYKQIAHISPAGNITWYTRPESIPGESLLRIEHTANAHTENTRRRLQQEMTSKEGYWRLLEEVAHYTPYEAWKGLFEQIRGTDDQSEKQNLLERFYLANF